jgi:polysaccharide biosynthesis protein PslH
VSLNVLVVDRSPPVNARQGNELIAIEVLPHLAHHRLVLVAPSPDVNADVASLGDLFDEVHLVPRPTWTPAIMGSLEPTLMKRIPKAPGMDLRAAREMARIIRAVANQRPFDVVHVRQLPMAGYAPLVPHGGRLLELVDSETLGAERALPRTLRSVMRARVAGRIERRAMASFDVVTAVAESDARMLRQLDPDRRVEVISNGVDAERFTRRPGSVADDTTLAFVGAMSFGPNASAVQWFCREVLPLVRARQRAVRLMIVGRDPSPAVRALGAADGVEVTGEVPDVRPYLERATVFVAPMVSGSGIKNKVLEAMSMELPVVATPLAVEGLPVAVEDSLVVTSTASDMADALVQLLGDPAARLRLGRSARHTVERHHSWAAAAAAYERLWHDIARRPGE